MKKVIATTVFASALVVGGSAAVFAYLEQGTAPHPLPPYRDLISTNDYKRMMNIIHEVNAGNLPVSALRETVPAIERNPKSVYREYRDYVLTLDLPKQLRNYIKSLPR